MGRDKLRPDAFPDYATICSSCTVEKATYSPHLPPTVPALATRWQNEKGDTFGSFSKRTFDAYYKVNQASGTA